MNFKGSSTNFLSDQLTLSQPGGAHYAHHFTKCSPGFLDLATALSLSEEYFRVSTFCMHSKKTLDENFSIKVALLFLYSSIKKVEKDSVDFDVEK